MIFLSKKVIFYMIIFILIFCLFFKRNNLEFFTNENNQIINNLSDTFGLVYSYQLKKNVNKYDAFKEALKNVIEELSKNYSDKFSERKVGNAMFKSMETFKKSFERTRNDEKSIDIAGDIFFIEMGLMKQPEKFTTKQEMLENNILKDIEDIFLKHKQLDPKEALEKATSINNLIKISRKYKISQEKLNESIGLAKLVFLSADFSSEKIPREEMLDTGFASTFRLSFEDKLK